MILRKGLLNMPFLTVYAVPEPPWPNLRPQFSGLVVSELRAVNTEGAGGQLPSQILADHSGSPIPTGRDITPTTLLLAPTPLIFKPSYGPVRTDRSETRVSPSDYGICTK